MIYFLGKREGWPAHLMPVSDKRTGKELVACFVCREDDGRIMATRPRWTRKKLLRFIRAHRRCGMERPAP